MKMLLVSFFAMLSLNSYSQMYASTNSYRYAKDQVLYVRQGIKLQRTGNIYLGDESQLLQGTKGTSTNQGAGKISVFQEGTADNFDYN